MHTGADPGFQVRGGTLKKIAPSGGGAKNFGVFRVKNHDVTPKNHIFPNFRGRTRWIRPWYQLWISTNDALTGLL